MGKDKPDIPEEMTESTRVAIGIVVGLVIAFGIAIVTVCLVCLFRYLNLLSLYRVVTIKTQTSETFDY